MSGKGNNFILHQSNEKLEELLMKRNFRASVLYNNSSHSLVFYKKSLPKKWSFPLRISSDFFKFFLSGFLPWTWPNPQETADLVTFMEEILKGKTSFLFSECSEMTSFSGKIAEWRPGTLLKKESIITSIFLWILWNFPDSFYRTPSATASY